MSDNARGPEPVSPIGSRSRSIPRPLATPAPCRASARDVFARLPAGPRRDQLTGRPNLRRPVVTVVVHDSGSRPTIGEPTSEAPWLIAGRAGAATPSPALPLATETATAGPPFRPRAAEVAGPLVPPGVEEAGENRPGPSGEIAWTTAVAPAHPTAHRAPGASRPGPAGTISGSWTYQLLDHARPLLCATQAPRRH